jgi:hypothetical protein
VPSAEENFQGSSLFFVGMQEAVKKNGTQTGYLDGTSGKEFGLVGEKYGCLVEIDLEGRQRGCHPVQHSSEDSPFSPAKVLSRDIQMLALDGSTFTQKRSVPQGSNRPDGNGAPPRPATIGIHAVRRAFGRDQRDGHDTPRTA